MDFTLLIAAAIIAAVYATGSIIMLIGRLAAIAQSLVVGCGSIVIIFVLVQI